MKLKIKVFVFGVLEASFGTLALFFGDMEEAVAICPDCGRNRYTGAPCVVEPSVWGDDDGAGSRGGNPSAGTALWGGGGRGGRSDRAAAKLAKEDLTGERP